MDVIKEALDKIPYLGFPNMGIRDIIDIIVEIGRASCRERVYVLV